jgi:mRNA interferase MazF
MVEFTPNKPLRFDVFLADLDPTRGSEMKKKRPCVVISPNEMHFNLSTLIVAPMTTKIKKYPTRVTLNFDNKDGQIALDQIRSVDKSRLIKKLGSIVDKKIQKNITDTLIKIFKE